jgi:hypothetical protein
MICPGCGEKIDDAGSFCRNCGAKLPGEAENLQKGEVTQASAQPDIKPDTQRTNKTLLSAAIAVVLLVAVGVFLAVGEPDKDKQTPGEQTAATNAQSPGAMEQTAETIEQPAENADNSQTNAPAAIHRKQAPRTYYSLDGRWDGTWRSGFNDSGACSVTIRQNRFSSLCYDSRFTGRIVGEGQRNIRFESVKSSWSCRLRHERGGSVLRCSFSVNEGPAGTRSGDLSLYRN